jgi:hypothetical protein
MFINQEAGRSFCDALEDPILRGLVTYAASEVFLMEDDPQGDFDMLYFSKLLSVLLPKVKAQLPPKAEGDVIFG